jgi:hypothetical protein
MIRKRICAVTMATLASFLLIGPRARPEQSPQTPGASAQGQPAPESSKKKVLLIDATRASTDKAAAGAAKQKTKAAAEENSARSDDSAVTEFRPAPPDRDAKGSDSIQKSERGPSKDIHGTVYGGIDSTSTGNRATGAAVGASTKSRKSSVYVEAQRTRETSPRH